MNDDDTYTFVVEWFDSVADLTRRFNLTYWPKDGSLSMYDPSKKRMYLKRVVNETIKFPEDLYLGKTIVVYSRQLQVVEYADVFTKNKFESISNSYTMVFMDLPSFTRFVAKINEYKSPFHFQSIKSVNTTNSIQQYFNFKTFDNLSLCIPIGCRSNSDCFWFSAFLVFLHRDSEVVITGEFVGSDNIKKAFTECQSSTFKAKLCEDADPKLMEFLKQSESSANLTKGVVSSLCVIKPHALPSAASIINDILAEGFHIKAVTTKKMTLQEAKDFYEVYQGVVKEHNYLIEQILSGSVIALQIECNRDNNTGKEKENQTNNLQDDPRREINGNSTFNEFRDFVGPKDPEIAKYIRPRTLRAKYGTDRVQNAVHCTDLQEDGHLESTFFFQILQ